MKTMSIYEAITAGTTVKNSAKGRVNSAKVGIDVFAEWRVAENNAFEAFYRYADARRKSARMGEKAVIDAEIVNNAFVALRKLLALIGDVNGHKVFANDAMLNAVAGCTMVTRKPLVGEALTQDSVVRNLREQFNGIHAGMNPEYVAKVTNDYEIAKVRLAELKKLEGSCETVHERVSANAFYLALENELATIVNAQDATPWEVLEAAAAARKAERDAKRKANKNAKKSAK
jgi:hypothetical protein